MKAFVTVVLLGACAGAMFSGAARADEVKVAVAANFKGTMERIGKEFTAKTGHSVVISSAATGVLYTQITHGAPFDLFLSADVVTPEKLEKEGKGSERFTYAIGRLGLWKKGGPAPNEASLRDWQGELAIANPKTAPYGAAAMATLAHLKIDPKQYRVLTGTNISQTWQFVDTGNAGLGFVAWANLVEAGKTGEAWAVPADFYPAIEQQGLVLKKGEAVEALVAWLKGPGQAQIKAAGYALPQ
ncbi:MULTISPECIES: molybdate ABC transporter substrate-binding protein [Aeromonas]|uniref:molybdate ABC transporter substrate-binding protein n=1 Tax=Aeromonas sp. SrichE-2G TaxID=2823359 RepID=UPI001B32D1F7|nr:molybdate ABC transporter substrate-binding protein [Aeromonas sp. SrichE-2G]MBP4040628.1 molybdate ABC transporter substrate-binding protein [Aeromonas sp. SrichE-2G]